jgi:Na+-driven multidrug efflux pump
VAGAVYMVAFLRRTQMDAVFSPRMLKARYARDIFRLSAPNSVQQASGTIITTVKQGLLGGLGVEAIAGFSCAGKLSSLLMMPVFGFVQSTVFFIAQNTAALQPGRVKEGLREGRRILLVYSLGVVAVCIGLRGPLLRLFTTDPAAASYGCTMLAFESVTYLFVAQKHLFEARLRGAQKMGLYLASSLGQIALNLLACVILVPRIGFAGFWMSSWISAPIGMLLAAALANLSGASHQLP